MTGGPTSRVPQGLPAHDHVGRRDRLREVLAGGRLGYLLVTSRPNVRYLTGFSGSNGQLLLAAAGAGDDRLITDARYEARAAVEAPGIEVILSRVPLEVAVDVAAGLGLGFEGAHLPWGAGEELKARAEQAEGRAVAVTGLVEHLREVKDDAEVARLERACELTVAALAWLFEEEVAPGRTEREFAVALERRMVDLGAEAVGFDSIVASGPNGAIPHHAPTDRPLVPGDLLTVDCGARVDGYHADCTRTVAVGHLDDDLGRVYEVVRAAQAAGSAAAVAGAAARDVDAAARDVIEEAGFGDAFVHGTGHGVGLEIHEAPAVSSRSDATLGLGTALTVEPGVYLPDLGGVRIEDTIVVTAEGPRPLTTAPRELRIL